MLKKYVNLEDLNEEEKRTGRISYARLCDRLFRNMILCNNILEVDEFLLDRQELGEPSGDEYYDEIFQWYIVDVDNWTLEKLKELNYNGILLYYCEPLEVYVLGVDHWGTSWTYVMTDIGYTDNLDEADL